MWYKDLANDADLLSLLQCADETLMNAPGKGITDAIQQLKSCIQRLADLKSIHGEELKQSDSQPPWLIHAHMRVRQGEATTASARLIKHLKETHNNPIKLKNLCKNVVAAIDKDWLGTTCRSFVHRHLLNAAREAIELKFQFPE
jgi:hypothetical protein